VALPLAVLLLVPLISRPAPRARRPLAWLLALLAAVFVLPTDYEVTIDVQPWATLALMVGFMMWVRADARATVAASMLLLPLIIATLAIYARKPYGQPEILGGAWFWTLAVGAVALLAAGVFGRRRQARIQPSSTTGPGHRLTSSSMAGQKRSSVSKMRQSRSDSSSRLEAEADATVPEHEVLWYLANTWTDG
jgi:hypothetical protein